MIKGTQQALSLAPKTDWVPLPLGAFKLKTDVEVQDVFPFIGLGAMVRDHNGEVLAAVSKPMHGSFDAEVGELLALREGQLLAKRSNLSVNNAETDVVNVALIVNSPVFVNSAVKFIVLKEVGNCM
ncbi:hypothetical protein LWI28_000389 [Acer negundo]|uniref:RNase H type-1 domain-containing protein n=1 Tax=Acer negundo TaxID=4023 RepID=A0AAD5NTL7_ACENE|nr:hypothetical protein LWI28_000389 [Acer negundo]